MVWSIPNEELKENVTKPAVQFDGHSRKVGHVLFHPTAENVLLSSGADLVIKLFDIQRGKEMQDVLGHPDIVNSISWNWNGSMIATACKDKKLRLIDVRANKVVQEVNAHQGVKGSRVVWCGDSNRIITTGFSKMSDRQFMVWDIQKMDEPLKTENLDTSSGGLIPHFDNDTKMLYLAGKGDGNIRYWEVVDEAQYVYPLSEFKTPDPQRGLAFMPKRALNVTDCEIARVYKVHPDRIEPISFTVPRKSDQFQSDIYPDTVGDKPSLTSEQWFSGKNADPKLISLEKGFQASERKEFVTEAVVTNEVRDPLKNPQSEKEYQDAFHALRKENDALKNELAQKDVRLRQLEMQLESMNVK
jgi:coronin-1B/1C/6